MFCPPNGPEVELAPRAGTGAVLIDRVGAVSEVTVVERGEWRVLAAFRIDGGRRASREDGESGRGVQGVESDAKVSVTNAGEITSLSGSGG